MSRLTTPVRLRGRPSTDASASTACRVDFVQHSKLKTLPLLLDGHRSFTLCGRSLQQAQNPFGAPGPCAMTLLCANNAGEQQQTC